MVQLRSTYKLFSPGILLIVSKSSLVGILRVVSSVLMMPGTIFNRVFDSVPVAIYTRLFVRMLGYLDGAHLVLNQIIWIFGYSPFFNKAGYL